MASPVTGGYGVDDKVSRTTTNTVQTAQAEDETGAIVKMETYGGIEEVTTEETAVSTFSNTALNGQSGTAAAAVTTEHTLSETNTDFNRVTLKTVKPLAPGA